MGCPLIVAVNQSQDERKRSAGEGGEREESFKTTSGRAGGHRASRSKGGRCGAWALAERAPRGHTCRPPKSKAQGRPARGARPSAERHRRNGQKLEGYRHAGVCRPPEKNRGVAWGVLRSSNVGGARVAVVLDARL